MKWNRWIKKGLLFALCVLLALPAVGLAAPVLRTEAAPEDPASDAYKEKAKENILEVYNIYKVKIKDAGNEKKAQKYLESMVGNLEPSSAVGGALATQKTEGGVDKLKETVEKDLEAYAVKEKTETPKEPEPQPTSSDSNIMVGGNWVTPVARGGQRVNVVLPVVNMGEDMVTDAVVTPVISSDPAIWPFEIETSNYSQVIADLPGTHNGGTDMERRRELTWTLKTRKDAPSGYVKIEYDVHYEKNDGTFADAKLATYVNVTGTTGVGADGAKSVPRVVVTGFTTDPAVVNAGDTFVLTLHMQNTSNFTSVKNMLFDIQAASESTENTYVAAAFLPTSGSSTIFVDSIPAGGTKDISMELEARADLAQKPYVVTVTMEYEDEKVNPYKNTANVSIPIRQDAKLELGNVQVMPESITVGGEANITFSVYNTGKTQLFNTKVKLQADSIGESETFLGNIAPGAVGNADMYVSGQSATMDDGTVKVIVSFEDETGAVSQIEQQLTLMVTEPMTEEMGMGDMEMMEEEAPKGMPWWLVLLIALLVIGAIVVLIVILRKRKQRRKAALEEQLLEEDLEDTGASENNED